MASAQVTDTDTSGASLNPDKSGIGSRIPKLWKASSIPNTIRNTAEGVQRTGRDLGRQSTVLARKKLPWLDSPQQSKPGDIPGSYSDKEGPSPGDAHDSPPPVPEKDYPPARNPNLSASHLHEDPAFRAIGSEPSLRTRDKPTDVKPLSLTSQHRPGVKPVANKRDAKTALGVVHEPSPGQTYSSSEYSLAPSTVREEMPAHLPTKDASSYERLVRKPVSPKYEQDVDLSPREVVKHHHHGRRHEARHSFDAQAKRNMPRAKTLPRRSFEPSTMEPQQYDVPQPGPPARQSTLYAMPTHLMPSESSSSYSPTQMSSPVMAPAQMVASQSSTRGSVVRRQRSDSLHRAVTGLGNLMEEAIHVARDAAQKGNNEEVANILDNATIALRHASVAQDRLNAGRMSSPLNLSPSNSRQHERTESESSIAPDSDASSTRSTTHTVATAPTMLTRSATSSRQPIIVEQYKPGGRAPTSQRAMSHHASGSGLPARRHSTDSISRTPPRLYQPPSADSIVRDFAYAREKVAKAEAARALSKQFGAASSYYTDHGESVTSQPGVRPSVSAPMVMDKPLPDVPGRKGTVCHRRRRRRNYPIHYLEPIAVEDDAPVAPPRKSSRQFAGTRELEDASPRRRSRQPRPTHAESMYQPAEPVSMNRSLPQQQQLGKVATGLDRQETDPRYANPPHHSHRSKSETSRYSVQPTNLLHRNISLRHPRRKHVSLREGQGFSLGRNHRRQPIAREWSTNRKRITATIACLNTVFIGLITGIYAGEVPRIQYSLGDSSHKVILGNVVFFATLGITTLIFWPLPLLHGRKPYMLLGFGLLLPLMFPQAMVVSGYRNPDNPIYRIGLLLPRAFEGIAMGFANINFLPTLFDLFGANLMSQNPHQEVVVYDDVRRQGGGVGVWLGIWSFCFVGSMSIGFCIGALIISSLSPAWGFYLIVIMLAFFLLVNVIAPETRRAPYRRSVAQYLEGDEETIKRRVARGEVKLHISNDGPKWWWEEVWAGIVLTKRMVFQAGFFVLMCYLGWMFAQVTLVLLLLGALLTRDYQWQPQWVGPAVLSVAAGALLAVPLSKANLFSRARDTPQRTDSMTMKHARVHWSSHMLRRCIFSLTLPFAALAYTLTSVGRSINAAAPILFCGLVGFLSNLAIAECVGFIMETFDTCDLQPGVNQRHRLQSMAETTRRRRTNYSSFPRICAGFFAAQSLGFFLSAAATGVSGDITRSVGAQMATAIVAAILLVLTFVLIIVLWRWREVQVIPSHAFTGAFAGKGNGHGEEGDDEWRPVIIGNPSGKLRRMSFLEMGDLTRWTEIRKLNKLVR